VAAPFHDFLQFKLSAPWFCELAAFR